MISKEELIKVSKLKGINNLGNAEKDYLLDLVLLSISKNIKNELVFKGGTCLYKFYKLQRFSEDLDFTLKEKIDIDNLLQKIIKDLNSFGVEAEIKDKKEVFNSVLFTIRTKGPLYSGKPNSLSNIRIDINLKSSIDIEPVIGKYNSFYSDVSVLTLPIMQEKEILAEKVRAVMSRNYARDVYDLWVLLDKGIEFDKKTVEEKLKYYKESWDYKKFLKKLNEKKDVWKTELTPLIMGDIPDFIQVKKEILKKIKS